MNKRMKWALIGGSGVLFVIVVALLFVGGNDANAGYTEDDYKAEIDRRINELIAKSEEQVDQLNTALLLNDKKLAETSALSLSMHPRFVIGEMTKKKIPESIRAKHDKLMAALNEMEKACADLSEAYKSGDIFADSVPCTITALDEVKTARDAIVK